MLLSDDLLNHLDISEGRLPWPVEARCHHYANGVALTMFLVERGKVPAATVAQLACPDVHLMAVTLMRAAFADRAERELKAEVAARRILHEEEMDWLMLAAAMAIVGFVMFLFWLVL